MNFADVLILAIAVFDFFACLYIAFTAEDTIVSLTASIFTVVSLFAGWYILTTL